MALPLGAIKVIVTGFITIILSFVALGCRIWSRRMLKLPLAFNDYMAIAATIFALGTVLVFLIASFTAGVGVHLQEILATNPQLVVLYLKLFIPAQLLWAGANTSVKFSILSLYTTIFPSKKFGYLCYGTMALSLAYFISVLLQTFVLCKPVQYSWDKSIPGGHCHEINTSYLAAGITNLVIDAFIVGLPMPMFFGLQMSLSKKLSIAGMFSLGAVICVLSLLRVIWLHNWHLDDMTYTVTSVAIYSILEPTLGVINACLPTIRPVLKRLSGTHGSTWSRNRIGGTKDSRNSNNSGQTQESGPVSSYNNQLIYVDNNESRGFKKEDTITVTRGWEISSGRPETRLQTPDSMRSGNWAQAEAV
ncbi:hypothetical protein F4775DRAFT_582067 [Biscogniauxia sp. FL1348]|nr:hypothetical protein F4775DRAFT_582067 [Biscogniauxia sp. FL1348]